ncbi:MAG TPA: penicillin acylase family protein, partial [Terriglobales bacterium]|nr:penicillin acylase family protein [Terriglobales bacterium]
VWGASIPGSPYIHIGHNRWIAWGITAAVCDDVELYREKIHRIDPNLYLAGQSWLPMEIRRETIGVRGTRSIQRNIRLTRHGPVISDFEPPLSRPAEVVAYRWTAHAPSTELRCLYGVNCASDWRGFLDSLSDQSAPTLNYVYADQEGNIGYTLAGKVPLRLEAPSLLPVEGWSANDEWRYIPFDELPRLYNPPEGIIASANNRIADASYPYYLSLLYEPPFRIRRIHELLGAKEHLSLEDMARMQMDSLSLHAKALTDALKLDLQSTPADEPVVAEASDRLTRWNGQCEASSVEAAIFHVFHHRLMANLLIPVLGEELFQTYVEIFNQCISPVDKILSEPDSPWFTPQARNKLVARSLREACSELKEALGDSPSSWEWGRIHKLLLSHALGRLKILRPLLSIGPFPTPGDGMTLNIGFYRHSNPYDQIVGASLRMIIDVGSWGGSGFVLPAGQSGHFRSPHYRDQTALWRSGQRLRLFLDESQEISLPCLTLEPLRA